MYVELTCTACLKGAIIPSHARHGNIGTLIVRHITEAVANISLSFANRSAQISVGARDGCVDFSSAMIVVPLVKVIRDVGFVY